MTVFTIWIQHFCYKYKHYFSQIIIRSFFDIRKDTCTKDDNEMYFDKHNRKYPTCESTKVYIRESLFDELKMSFKPGRKISFIPNKTQCTMLHKYPIKALKQ